MTTAVSICSNALLMLGKTPIADFNENSDRARYCSNLYPMVRDQLLRKHYWNCAIKRVLLSPLANGGNAHQAARRMLGQRLRFMTELPTWPAFGRGWSKRVAALLEA